MSLVLRGSNVLDATLTTAGDMSLNATGGTETSVASGQGVGSSSGYHELGVTAILGNASGSLPAQSGKGWVYKPGAGSFDAANWSGKFNLAGSSSFSLTQLVLRTSKWNGSTYTTIGTIALSSPAFTTSKALYTFAGTSLGSFSTLSSDFLYFDLFGQGSWAANQHVSVFLSTSASAGVASDVEVTTATFTAGGLVLASTLALLGVG